MRAYSTMYLSLNLDDSQVHDVILTTAAYRFDQRKDESDLVSPSV